MGKFKDLDIERKSIDPAIQTCLNVASRRHPSRYDATRICMVLLDDPVPDEVQEELEGTTVVVSLEELLPQDTTHPLRLGDRVKIDLDLHEYDDFVDSWLQGKCGSLVAWQVLGG